MDTKTCVGDLAVFGGKAVFTEKLHVGRPNEINRQSLMKRLNDILDRKWLTNDGPCVQEFERKVADFVGVRHCIATCNATIGLQIAIRSLGMTGEVLLPSMTFIATAHALEWQGITPVFCDSDEKTWNIEPSCAEKMITPRTSGIIGVHLFGRSCPVDQLAELARRHKLRLLYDAAHAFGCSAGGRMIGSFGDAEVFSFHATKFFNSLEGGAIVTNSDSLAAKMRMMRNFGFSGYDRVDCIGTNGKMNEFSAAVGLTSFESLPAVIDANERNYHRYLKDLAGVPGITIIDYPREEKCNFQYVVLKIDDKAAHLSRDRLCGILWAENVIARRYFSPGCHRMEPYKSCRSACATGLPVAERLSDNLLSLPTGTNMSCREIDTLCDVIRFCVYHGPEICARLEQRAATTSS